MTAKIKASIFKSWPVIQALYNDEIDKVIIFYYHGFLYIL